MRKLNGEFRPNNTEIKRAMAHARRLASQAAYDGSIEVFFNKITGVFHFREIVGTGYTEVNDDYYMYFGVVYTPAR